MNDADRALLPRTATAPAACTAALAGEQGAIGAGAGADRPGGAAERPGADQRPTGPRCDDVQLPPPAAGLASASIYVAGEAVLGLSCDKRVAKSTSYRYFLGGN